MGRIVSGDVFYVVVQSWAGAKRVPVEVLKRTAKRIKIRLLEGSAKAPAGAVRYVLPDVVRSS